MESILSSVCSKNSGDLTSSALLEDINTTLTDPLIGTYNDLANDISSQCGGASEINQIIDNMGDCNMESFTQAYNAYFGIASGRYMYGCMGLVTAQCSPHK